MNRVQRLALNTAAIIVGIVVVCHVLNSVMDDDTYPQAAVAAHATH